MHIHTHVLPEKMRPSHALSLEAFVAAQRLLEPALAGPSFCCAGCSQAASGVRALPMSACTKVGSACVCIDR